MDSGFGIVDSFLPETETVQALEAQALMGFRVGELRPAGISRGEEYTQNRQIRGDHIQWLSETDAVPEVNAYLEVMTEFSDYLNRTCFAGIRSREFHFAVYPPGTFYKRHLDRFRNGDARIFSAIYYLNSDWEDDNGGELVLYLPGGPERILPLANRLVVFRSELLEHEVLPANRPRASITGWLRRDIL